MGSLSRCLSSVSKTRGFSTLIVFSGANSSPNPRARVRVKVGVSLGLLQRSKIRRYSSFALGFRSSTQLVLTFHELTSTLTLELEWGLAWGYFDDGRFFTLTSFKDLSRILWRYVYFALGFRYPTLIVCWGANPDPSRRSWVRVRVTSRLTRFKYFSLEVVDDLRLLHLFSDSLR